MKMSKEITKAMKNLNDAVTNLPEFGAVMKLVPEHVAISNCELLEYDTTRKWGKGTNMISYHGRILHDGDGKNHLYMIQCCGAEIFCTDATLDQIAKDIQTALEKAPKKRDKVMHSLSVSDYLMNELDWELNDEIYPHMRSKAEGTFIIKKFELLM